MEKLIKMLYTTLSLTKQEQDTGLEEALNNVISGIKEDTASMNALRYGTINKSPELSSEHIFDDIYTSGLLRGTSYGTSITSCIPKHEKLESVKLFLETIDKKNDEYTVDPISMISIDDLITQILIKVIRARYANTKEKRLDELNDISVYSTLTREKVLNEE